MQGLSAEEIERQQEELLMEKYGGLALKLTPRLLAKVLFR